MFYDCAFLPFVLYLHIRHTATSPFVCTLAIVLICINTIGFRLLVSQERNTLYLIFTVGPTCVISYPRYSLHRHLLLRNPDAHDIVFRSYRRPNPGCHVQDATSDRATLVDISLYGPTAISPVHITLGIAHSHNFGR